MSSQQIEDFFIPSNHVIRGKILKQMELGEGFIAEEHHNFGNLGIDRSRLNLEGNYDFNRSDVRKIKIDKPSIVFVRSMLKREVRINDVEKESWLANIFATQESSFWGKLFYMGGEYLIELVDEATGKVFYISPPETDVLGKKFSSKKKYRVVLKRNVLTGKKMYEFFPLKPLITTIEENQNVLKRVADTI